MLFGFLYEVKGVDLALEAVSGLIESGREMQLILILTSHIDEIKEKIVRRFGCIPAWLHLLPPRNDIASYFLLCDAFLAPSRSEGLPYSVLEASYLRVPVVLSDIAAHKSLALPCGHYFESENVSEMKKQLVCALDLPHTAEEMQAQSEQIYTEYRLEEWSDRILEIYTNL